MNPGDEVIIPSWGHPADCNAVVRAGGVPVFVDVDEDLNISPEWVLKAITRKTKAILPVHYAGVVSDMKAINSIAKMYGLYVIEDAAQALGNWKVSGDCGCVSFHSTKNVQCGEGGALILNNPVFEEKAEVLMDFGSNRAKFKRGEVKRWDYLLAGSSYRMSAYAASHLYEELQKLPEITARRQARWDELDQVIDNKVRSTKRGNGHLYWCFVNDKWNWLQTEQAKALRASSHFDALHLTLPGRKYGRVGGPIIKAVEAMKSLVKLATTTP